MVPPARTSAVAEIALTINSANSGTGVIILKNIGGEPIPVLLCMACECRIQGGMILMVLRTEFVSLSLWVGAYMAQIFQGLDKVNGPVAGTIWNSTNYASWQPLDITDAT